MKAITGVDEFERDCAEDAHALERELPEIVMRAANLVEEEVRRRAPRDTGELVAHLDRTSATRRRSRASATVQIEDSGAQGREHYAVYKEYGTSKMAAEPFFRPGVEAARDRAEDEIEAGIASTLERRYGDR
jgi:HK97 gp10 family phage protein